MINTKSRVLKVSNAHLKVICKLLELGMKYCCLGKNVQSINSINKSSCMMKFSKGKIHLIENINKQVKVWGNVDIWQLILIEIMCISLWYLTQCVFLVTNKF